MKKTVLVTGSNGQLGRSLQEKIENHKQKDDLYIFTNSENLDITNKTQIVDFFNKHQIHYCINCAAYTAVDKAEDEVERANLVNAEAVGLLATECKKKDVVFIHISTDYVFDGTKTSPYLPNDAVNPQSIYGKSKLKGEELALDMNSNTHIIRTSWVYSPFGNNFKKTMEKLFKEKEELSIVADQFGRPTDALKLAEYIIKIINTEDQRFGIRHFASEEAMSWYQFAVKIKKEMNAAIILHPITTEEFHTKAKRPKYSVLETTYL